MTWTLSRRLPQQRHHGQSSVSSSNAPSRRRSSSVRTATTAQFTTQLQIQKNDKKAALIAFGVSRDSDHIKNHAHLVTDHPNIITQNDHTNITQPQLELGPVVHHN